MCSCARACACENFLNFPPRDIFIHQDPEAEYLIIWWKSPAVTFVHPSIYPPPPRSSLSSHPLLTTVVRFIQFLRPTNLYRTLVCPTTFNQPNHCGTCAKDVLDGTPKLITKRHGQKATNPKLTQAYIHIPNVCNLIRSQGHIPLTVPLVLLLQPDIQERHSHHRQNSSPRGTSLPLRRPAFKLELPTIQYWKGKGRIPWRHLCRTQSKSSNVQT